MTTSISLFDPTPSDLTKSQQERRVLNGLQGKVVGFIDNAKPNFHFLVDDVAELLVSRHGVKSTIKHQKRGAAIPAADVAMDDLAAQCDLIVAGSGD